MIRYFTSGSLEEAEGLTVFTGDYDKDGELIFGCPNKLYKQREISEDEYKRLNALIADPSVPHGFVGIVNEIGLQAYEKKKRDQQREINQRTIQENESKIALVVKKIKKQLELGIISSEDIDAEIGLNNMMEFAEEIKRRLEQ